jgi:hypothetical protein
MSHPRLIVSEVARLLGVPPREISDLFYQRRLDDEICPVVGGRRLIPVEYIPVIRSVLQQRNPEGGAAGTGRESA